MENYDHKNIEGKWQEKWLKDGIYKTSEDANKPKSYVLDMFPYPSGEGLHVGHPKGYIATDIYSRMKKMQGFNVLHPMGWDAFGLPAENFAIKNKIHPRVAVEKNIKRFKEQLAKIGFNYDWEREINTTDPEYYRWTQWVFLKMLEKGLAYQSYEPINWCPSCQTGLANEDLEKDGTCERCGSVVEKKPMRQWVLKITDYADRMLADLDALKWPEYIKESQRNWIGRSEGMLFTAPVKDTDLKIQTFNAHFEAFKADTFVVIAPDHPFLKELIKGTENEKEVLDFAKKLVEKRLEQGYATEKESEGIFTGRYIVDPVGNGDLPIWVASYALADYGTGIVKCSAHDERDFAFAKKYNIKLKPVLFPEDHASRKQVENLEICFTDMKNGVLVEPEGFNNKRGKDLREEIIGYLEKNKLAERKTTYKLKDWVFSRQRYWGEPIPVVHCEKCGVVGVPEKDLPVMLPDVENYAPTGTGESPLANIEDWVNTTCPKCGGRAKRETNTMPQWAGSSWYYIAYCMSENLKSEIPISKQIQSTEIQNKINYWLPVDVYVGGDHAVRHLIYARFWHKFLYDIGSVSTIEPFARLEFLGFILAKDGRKMSKRWGNVINPDDIVDTWGADTLRLYEMFMGPFENTIAWNDDNLIGVRRFLERVWKLSEKIKSSHFAEASRDNKPESLLHKTIKKVGEDIESFKFNTAVSTMMIFINEFEHNIQEGEVSKAAFDTFGNFLKLLAPFAPHVTEEIWSHFAEASWDKPEAEKYPKSIHLQEWPKFDESKIKNERVTIVIQINGKVRAEFEAETGIGEEEAKEKALGMTEVQKWIDGKDIKKVIYVPNKLVSIVV